MSTGWRVAWVSPLGLLLPAGYAQWRPHSMANAEKSPARDTWGYHLFHIPCPVIDRLNFRAVSACYSRHLPKAPGPRRRRYAGDEIAMTWVVAVLTAVGVLVADQVAKTLVMSQPVLIRPAARRSFGWI